MTGKDRTPDEHFVYRKAYGFEDMGFFGFGRMRGFGRATEKAYGAGRLAGFFETFRLNLGLGGGALSPRAAGILGFYIENLHANADWFHRRMVASYRMRWVWFAVSLAFLLGIVLVSIFMPSLVNGDDQAEARTAATVAAQIIAALTGIFFVYRSLNQWMVNNDHATLYWEGRAKLLARIFKLESTWRARPDSQRYAPAPDTEEAEAQAGRDLSPDLEAALLTDIAGARTETAAQMKAIFEKAKVPTVELSEIEAALKVLTERLAPGSSAKSMPEALMAALAKTSEASRRAAEIIEVTEQRRALTELRDALTDGAADQKLREKLDGEVKQLDARLAELRKHGG